MIYRVESSIADLKKYLREHTDNVMLTRGGLFPAHSQYNIIVTRKMHFAHCHAANAGDKSYAGEEYIREQIKVGKVFYDIKRDIENHRDNKLSSDKHEALYEKMVTSNMDVFFGRKTIQQAEIEYKEVEDSFSFIAGGKKAMESYESTDAYLEKVEAVFEKVKNEGAKVSGG